MRPTCVPEARHAGVGGEGAPGGRGVEQRDHGARVRHRGRAARHRPAAGRRAGPGAGGAAQPAQSRRVTQRDGRVSIASRRGTGLPKMLA